MAATVNGGFDLTATGNTLKNALAASAMAWVNPSSLNIGDSGIYEVRGNTNDPRFFFRIDATGRVYIAVRHFDVSTTSFCFSTGLVSVGIWTHVGVAYNCSNQFGMFYINGLLDSQAFLVPGTTGPNFENSNSSENSVGTGLGGLQNFLGTLEDVRLYNRVVQSSEFATVYAQRGKDMIVQGLIARYPLKELAISQNAVYAADISPSLVVLPANVIAGPLYVTGISEPVMKPLSTASH